MNRELILVLGGARGGKSNYAEDMARKLGDDDVVFVATAQGLDEEMRSRIASHRAARPSAWHTVETPSLINLSLDEDRLRPRVIVVDCLTLLVSNALLGPTDGGGEVAGGTEPESCGPSALAGDVDDESEARVEREIDALLEEYGKSRASWIVVSNEVGLGLVPGNPLGRSYRDALGRANQRVAAAADQVVLMVAGLPLRVK